MLILGMDPKQLEVINKILTLSFTTLYVLGPGGYGKTAAIRNGVSGLKNEEIIKEAIKVLNKTTPFIKICVVAMTSVAADVLGEIAGIQPTTFHSWWEIGKDSLRMHDEGHLKRTLNSRKPSNPLDTDVLIIDEASMLTIQVLEVMDRVLRWYRKNPNVRFGGLKVIIVGDPMQLPPVAPSAGPGLLRDERVEVASCLSVLDDRPGTHYVILNQPHRCDNMEFQCMLRNLISDSLIVRRSAMETFSEFYRHGFGTIPDIVRKSIEMGAVIISHRTEIVDLCNRAVRDYLHQQGAKEYYFSDVIDLFTYSDVVSIPNEDGINVEEELQREKTAITVDRKRYFTDRAIREGQIVQIRANHTSANGIPVRIGDLCIFKRQDESGNAIVTRIKDKQEIAIGKHESQSEYWTELKWTGYPFIPANAATVHLVQGQTIHGPVIFYSDIRGDIYGDIAFYLNVAASRVTNPANFIITHPMSKYALDSHDVQENLAVRWQLDYMRDYPR
jgi:hypothetical protein